MSDSASSIDAIDERFVPVRSSVAFVVELDGEAVVLDERANRLHLLNRTATLVWNCLDGEVDIRGLAAEIGEVLGVRFDDVLADTVSVVRNLGTEGLLEGVSPPEPP